MTRPQAADRLRRVLALVPYIAARDEVSVAELARTFGVSETVILRDLEVLPFCGLPPYTADRLIDVAIVAGCVSVRFAEYFSRPLRLTPAEGFALLAAGRALLAVPGSEAHGPLASALAKLERTLGAHEVVEVDIGDQEHVERLHRAAAGRERLEIDYYSFGRDTATTRRIDPYAVVTLRGNWYLAAYCHSASDDRLFRVDRIQAVRETGEQFDARAHGEVPADVFQPSAQDTRVTLSLPGSASWVAESYPVESVKTQRGGRLRVVLAVSTRAFLERLLLLVGPEATVISPRGWKTAGAEAASRVLALYER